jgi:hypothetical protein
MYKKYSVRHGFRLSFAGFKDQPESSFSVVRILRIRRRCFVFFLQRRRRYATDGRFAALTATPARHSDRSNRPDQRSFENIDFMSRAIHLYITLH